MCDQVLNVVAGKISDAEKAKSLTLIESARVAIDSHLRVLITEPKTHTVHILDFAKRKYSRIEGENGDRMSYPYGIAARTAISPERN